MTKMGQKRTSPKRPLKKKSLTTIKHRIDTLFSKYIRDRANNVCEYCGLPNKAVECHHGVVHRRYMNTRYEAGNCICVCKACHRFLSDFPNINSDFFRKRIGSDRVEQLEILARSGKNNRPDMEMLEKKLRGK